MRRPCGPVAEPSEPRQRLRHRDGHGAQVVVRARGRVRDVPPAALSPALQPAVDPQPQALLRRHRVALLAARYSRGGATRNTPAAGFRLREPHRLGGVEGGASCGGNAAFVLLAGPSRQRNRRRDGTRGRATRRGDQVRGHRQPRISSRASAIGAPSWARRHPRRSCMAARRPSDARRWMYCLGTTGRSPWSTSGTCEAATGCHTLAGHRVGGRDHVRTTRRIARRGTRHRHSGACRRPLFRKHGCRGDQGGTAVRRREPLSTEGSTTRPFPKTRSVPSSSR